MRLRNPITAAITAAILFVSDLEAGNRDLSAWSNLEQLASGTSIEVIDMNLKSARGEFLAASSEELNFRSPAGVFAIPRARLFRVSKCEKPKRLRNALIGMAVGAAAGLAIGAVADRRFSEDGEHVAKLLLVPIGVGVGAGLGVALSGFETIYRASRRTVPAPVSGKSE